MLWKLAAGVGILYLLACIFLFFLNISDARLLFFAIVDPKQENFAYMTVDGKKIPKKLGFEKNYAEDCRIFTPEKDIRKIDHKNQEKINEIFGFKFNIDKYVSFFFLLFPNFQIQHFKKRCLLDLLK